jgi:hypothetical protein
MDTDHDVAITIMVSYFYKVSREKQKTIVIRLKKISDMIEEIGNIYWQLLIHSNTSPVYTGSAFSISIQIGS